MLNVARHALVGILIGGLTGTSGCRTREEPVSQSSSQDQGSENHAKLDHVEKQLDADLQEKMPGWRTMVEKNGKLQAIARQQIAAQKITDVYLVPPANEAKTQPIVHTRSAVEGNTVTINIQLLNAKMQSKARGTIAINPNDGKTEETRKLELQQTVKSIWNTYSVATTGMTRSQRGAWEQVSGFLFPTAHAVEGNKCDLIIAIITVAIVMAVVISGRIEWINSMGRFKGAAATVIAQTALVFLLMKINSAIQNAICQPVPN